MNIQMDWHCDRYHCWMTKHACDARRKKAEQLRIANESNVYKQAGCHNCKQEASMTKDIEIESKIPETIPPYTIKGSVDKECKKCRQIKPLEAFSICKAARDGHEGQCKQCRYDMQKAKAASLKAEKKRPETKPQETKPPDPPEKPTEKLSAPVEEKKPTHSQKWIDAQVARMEPASFSMSLDFKGHPELYEAVHDVSKKEFRSPEMQVMFWLKQALVENGYIRYNV